MNSEQLLRDLGALAREERNRAEDSFPPGALDAGDQVACLFAPLTPAESKRLAEAAKRLLPPEKRAPVSRRWWIPSAGAMAAVALVLVSPALSERWFPKPVPGFGLTWDAAYRAHTDPSGGTVRLASSRASVALLELDLIPRGPLDGAVSVRAYVESGGALHPLDSTLTFGPRGEQHIALGWAAGAQPLPDGPATLVLFVGREAQLPDSPYEAQVLVQSETQDPAYRVLRQDALIEPGPMP